MIGVVLMIVLTIVLASILATVAFSMGDRLHEPDFIGGSQNPWADDPLLGAENPVAGAEDVRYRVFFEIEAGESGPLNHLVITVDTDEDDMFSGTDKDDLETFDVIRANGSRVDLTPAANWAAADNELEISPEDGAIHVGSEDGETIEIIFGGVDNPADPGFYAVNVSIKQGAIEPQQGELEIVAG